ncbi:dTDP-4-dehydrorhamnose 3,5-epimerase family protein [Butyrivibrio sp. WCD3002]|uniref:dTDP-4-dehydrorhamnose 3,5-epimerase family protein n=1 Tax=Butyrivibrio sp. WCD3002 TaxID=1280676 RepID=UPI000429F899|nr:dTDP-4-dehydrorhamnose 3,5-epimerase [Butyrivibrio sp. WCD3002]
MSTHIEPFEAMDSSIEGLKIINVKSATDDRGTVRELFRSSIHSEVLPRTVTGWKQINLTRTKKGAVRGLHGEAMNKLVTVAYGSVFGAYVDTRPGSKTFGAVQTVYITPGVQVFVPQGVCNGFQALEDSEYLYFFDNEWAPGMPGTALCPLAPELGINWPIDIDTNDLNQISEKDSKAPTLTELRSKLWMD